ncbi:endolytic transglycosylase MltG [Actinomyces vulturis]|uniref:endolytic transglycosylase MltG n=1 Tax=Actinomyces vulturis TaxID=1857645 RepID=UPI00082F24B7|nr:endolytic transglycosylase MltG [Actinomyces vulturis]
MSDDLFNELGIEPPARSNQSGRRSGRRRQGRAKRRIITTFILLLVIGLVGGMGYAAFDVVRNTMKETRVIDDYTEPGTGEVIVTIPEGATGQVMAKILVDNDVVATQKAFINAFNANANSASIQAGTYTLKHKMPAADAVAALLDPSSRDGHTMTIPEGYTKDQVKARLMSVGGFTAEEIDEAFGNTEAIKLPAQAGGNVEGWLAPATYDIANGLSAQDVVASMVDKTVQRLQQAGVPEDQWEAILTKASIIEREVSLPQYFPQVARVIDNRLNNPDGETRGLLQMDSTVLYGLGRTGGIPTEDEIKDASNPYNTYVHQGLPPTPIGSPGSAAIDAAIHPADGNWLYFVTVDLSSGETLFADTLSEQKENTKKLTDYCQEHEDQCSGNSH